MVGSVGRYIPIYDAWSNEGGGRAIEEGIRYSERAMLEEIRPRALRAIEGFNRREVSYRAELKELQDAFVARYGADALANNGPTLRSDPGDKVTLSDEATAMLTDLAKLERERVRIERALYWDDRFRQMSIVELEGAEAGVAARQSSYDARFEKDDQTRADAYERAEAARGQLREQAARSAAWNEGSTRRAGEVASAMSSSAALFASTKLFEFGRDGSVKIDPAALSNMGTTEAATSELARLIGALTERNGLGQLRDALIGAINGQNRRIAELTGTREGPKSDVAA